MTATPLSTAIRLVCFDVGGVLIRARNSYPEAVLAAGLPLRLPEAEITVLFESAEDIRQAYRTGRIVGKEYCAGLSRVLHEAYTPEEILRIRDGWLYDPYPGTASLLRDLSKVEALRIALLSNTCLEHWSQMGKFPWMAYVDYSFPSHELGLAKPAPEVFHVVEVTTCMAPSEILFFDDNFANVNAAAACGWNTVLIDPAGNVEAQIREALGPLE